MRKRRIIIDIGEGGIMVEMRDREDIPGPVCVLTDRIKAMFAVASALSIEASIKVGDSSIQSFSDSETEREIWGLG